VENKREARVEKKEQELVEARSRSMAYLHQLPRGTSSLYPNGILNETRRHPLAQERIKIKCGLRKGDVNQARKQSLEDWNTHLPTPLEEVLDCEMNRSPGKSYSLHRASNTPIESQMSRYVQEDEIIYSSSSSSSDDEAIGSRASKPLPLPRQSQDIDKHLEQTRVPPYAVPAHQGGRKAGPFPPIQTGHNTLLKRTADGQTKPRSLDTEKYRSLHTLPQGRPPKQGLTYHEEDDSDLESPGRLLRNFESLADAKLPERLGLGADDYIPFALQSADDTDFHPLGRAVATNRENPTNSLPTHVLSHRSSLSHSTATTPSLAPSQASNAFLSSARSVPKPSHRPPRKETRDDSNSDSDFSSGLKPSNKSLRFAKTHPSQKKFRDHRGSSRLDSKDSFHVRSLPPPSQALKERASQFPRPFKLSQPATSQAPKVPHSKTHSRLPGRKSTSPHSPSILRSGLTTLLNREFGNRDRHQIMMAAAIQTDSYAALRSTRKWHGASGDIIVVGWSADGLQYAAGAATAMDIQNPQYNKRYNLLAGDLGLNTLRELPDHYQGLRRTTGYSVEHPVPLYTTVSDLKWDVEGAHMYSSSYDWTVKRWDMTEPTGPQCVETFWHENPVEVMAISTVDDNGLLATGTNQSNTRTDTPLSLFNVYNDDAQNGHHSKISLPNAGGFKGYTPTVMQWGSTNATKEYLVAGLSGKHHKNLEDPPSHGLLCLWNISDDRGVIQKKLMPSSSNVFDAVWHPTKEWLAAGGPINYMSAANYAAGTRSLIRVYDPLRATHKIVEYECPALDMNTISFSSTNPNIISSSCTDGVTYFWDHRKQSEVLCKLVHGDSLYPTGSLATRELHDTGVRVALWGAGGDSFYTGSSDGVLKQWDIKLAPEDTLVRDVETFPAEVMSGKFSPDFSSLLIGDAAGGIHILSTDPNNSGEEDDVPSEIVFERAALSTSNDDGFDALAQKVDETARPAAAAAQELIRSGQIVVDPVFGPGQGPRYAGPYAGYAHTDGDPANTLIPEIRALQLDEHQSRGYESLLDEESTRRKRANQGLARARNGGASGAGTVSGVGEKRARIVDLESETSAEEDAGNSRRKKAGQPFEYVISDNSDDESVMVKEEEEGVRFAPSAWSSAGRIAVPGSSQQKGNFIDLTLDD
jgi:WD40 repeat protein